MKWLGLIVNNTDADLRPYEDDIRETLGLSGEMPEELADIFHVELVGSLDESRYMISWMHCDACADLGDHLCGSCSGTGAPSPESRVACETCRGSGSVRCDHCPSVTFSG